MNYVIARGSSNFRQNGSVFDKVEKLHLKGSSLSPESSTVVHRRLFNRLTEISFNGKAIEKSICCSLTLMLARGICFIILRRVTSKQLRRVD